MKWFEIDSQDSLDILLKKFDWGKSFIREMHLVSPSFISLFDLDAGYTYHPDALPSSRILITSTSSDLPAVELLFIGLESLDIMFLAGELYPSSTWESQKISWSFHKNDHPAFCAARLRYRWLDKSVHGQELRYGSASIEEND